MNWDKSLPFVKLEGLGNDFIFLDASGWSQQRFFPLSLSDLSPRFWQRLCHRQRGIGADQVCVLLPADEGSKALMRIHFINPDGSFAEMCGNGFRALGHYLRATCPEKASSGTTYQIQTPMGDRFLRVHGPAEDPMQWQIEATMGQARCAPQPQKICLASAGGKVQSFLSVDVGNPHAVFWVEAPLSSEQLALWGQEVENHPFFPHRTNVHFVQALGSCQLRAQIWERGAGATLACGSGACAIAAAAWFQGRVQNPADSLEITFPGGTLWLSQDLHTGELWQKGPARWVYEGTFQARAFQADFLTT